jgi:hypothetical protein
MLSLKRAGLAFLLATAVLAPWVATASDTIATVVTKYNPSSMRVVAVERGYCWEGSLAANRTDAYRCTAHGVRWHGQSIDEIQDPCFVDGAQRVACPHNLVANTGVTILISSLPASPASWPHAVWAMELENGAVCEIITGMGPGNGYTLSCNDATRTKTATTCMKPYVMLHNYYTTCARLTPAMWLGRVNDQGLRRRHRVIRIWE